MGSNPSQHHEFIDKYLIQPRYHTANSVSSAIYEPKRPPSPLKKIMQKIEKDVHRDTITRGTMGYCHGNQKYFYDAL